MGKTAFNVADEAFIEARAKRMQAATEAADREAMRNANLALQRAMKHARAAASNFSQALAETGDTRAMQAGHLISQILHALEYGSCYQTASHARSFDQAVEDN